MHGTFVDVGANVGDSLQAWYGSEGCADLKERWVAQGKPWPGIKRAGCLWYFPDWLPLRARRRFCAQAFEPNPQLAETLHRSARALEVQHGVSIDVFNSTAFATEAGYARPFYIAANSVSSSLLAAKGRDEAPTADAPTSTVRVAVVDGVAHLEALARQRPGRPIVAKLDVEGLETVLVRELLVSGVLCKHVHALFVEWHSSAQLGKAATSALSGAPRGIHEAFKWMLPDRQLGRQRLLRNFSSQHGSDRAFRREGWDPTRCGTALLDWSR